MSNHSFRQIVIVAFGLTLSGFAFARNPPALVTQQQAAAHATQSGGGYRDVNYRFGLVGARSPEVMQASGGYRDVNYRFLNRAASGRTASAPAPSRWR